jgi:poly[(R)-3-hydroxyalkanoate] polymerase subunit PhaC
LPAERENALDHIVHTNIARLTGGFSPMALGLATFDWGLHLAVSPGKQADLALSALAKQAALLPKAQFFVGKSGDDGAVQSRAQDRRFRAEEWGHWPFLAYGDAFLAAESWWDKATSEINGASRHHLEMVNFVARQALDTVAPSNFLPTNPVALKQTINEGGANLLRGALNYAGDLKRLLTGERSQAEKAFKPGETVAITKGVVVKRTPLAEVIQYSPTTAPVRAEPVVIVPAWIMKYYILDLRPEDSLILYLVDSGFTVFCISWRNPTSEDRNVGFDDYRREGVMPALDAALAITGASKAHLVGYCLGGTLAAITAASMARDKDDRLQTLSLFAGQTDFEEAGELRLFIDDSQLVLLEDMMWQQGTLESSQMAGTFSLLHSNDLIWSRVIHHYLMGEPERVDDLIAWDSDATRMPFRMHGQYLRELYLDNDLAEGRFKLDGRLVALQDIRVPLFVVGTERDHVAPWRSVFKIHYLTDTDVTFALVSGGHNRGIVAPPDHGKFVPHLRIATTAASDPRPDPDAWPAAASYRDGSWWPAWSDWLAARSSGIGAPPPLGDPERGLTPLCSAPGEYVRQ